MEAGFKQGAGSGPGWRDSRRDSWRWQRDAAGDAGASDVLIKVGESAVYALYSGAINGIVQVKL